MLKIAKKLIIFILIFGFLFVPKPTKANAITDLSVSLGNGLPITDDVHTLSFSLATTWALKKINVRYHKKDGDMNKPSHLSLNNSIAGAITGLGGTWSVDFTGAASGLVVLQNSEEVPTELTADTSISFFMNNVTNPELGDCSMTTMKDTCMVTIETVDSIENTIDVGSDTYDISEDPSLSFIVYGVESGTTTNGIVTSISTEFDRINFGNLAIIEPKFGAQKMRVESNSPNGYEVKMKLDGYIEALNPTYKIDPFGPYDVTWNDPGVWQSPFGSCDEVSCSDTGWIGANTSDTRIGGSWANASGKFGPVSSTSHLVMSSAGRDIGTDVYVTYGLEVNENQPPDNYAGTLIYDILARY